AHSIFIRKGWCHESTERCPKGMMQRFLDVVEKVGNKIPHPIIIFLTLIVIVVLLSHVLYLLDVSAPRPRASYEIEAVEESTPDIYYKDYIKSKQEKKGQEQKKDEDNTIAVKSLLTSEGVRFMYTSLIPNFMGFAAVGLMIVAMVGAGVAESSGLVNALIRKLVAISPSWAMTYILVFVGIVSSVAADAGYLVLIPLAGTAFLGLGRHPIAGLAPGFAAVAAAFTVNILIKPLDAVLTEFTNDSVRLVDPSKTIGLTANLWFSLASLPMLTVIIALITERLIEPRLGKF